MGSTLGLPILPGLRLISFPSCKLGDTSFARMHVPAIILTVIDELFRMCCGGYNLQRAPLSLDTANLKCKWLLCKSLLGIRACMDAVALQLEVH